MSSRSTEINEIATALAKAQLRIVGAVKDSTNPHFKASYADLASVWDACHTALNENGIAVVQTIDSSSERMLLCTTLMHSSGQWLSSDYPVVPVQNTPQGYGSALTYARRYSLMSMAGVAGRDDDDGNAASAPSQFANLPAERSAPKSAAVQPKPPTSETPPMPNVVTSIPAFFCVGPFKPLSELEGVTFNKMLQPDLEMVVSLISENKVRIKSDIAKSWANALEAAALVALRNAQEAGFSDDERATVERVKETFGAK